MKTRIDQERAMELLSYDAEAGALRWRVSRKGHVRAGDLAGRVMANGYISIGIDGAEYLAHRVAWLMRTGAWPAAQIDHINGRRADNRWSNLREATNAENGQNRSAYRSNKAGRLGVSWNKAAGRWHAQLTVNRKRIHVGFYTDPDAAHAAYLAAKLKHHGFSPAAREDA